jgi:hypothetical protein
VIVESYPATRGERVWERRKGSNPDVSAYVVRPVTRWVLVDRGDVRELRAAVADGRLRPVDANAVVCGPGERPTRAQLRQLRRVDERGGTAAARGACGGRVVVERAAAS